MKKAIVVGATSGIGKELARLLVNNDYSVGITGRRTELLSQLKLSSPSNFIIKTFDITNTDDSVQKVEELVNELGGIDLLILSSGTGDLNDKLNFTIEKRAIDTNVGGFTCMVDWAFNYFEKQKFGHLVAINSVGGLRGSRQSPAYSASKAYQINYLGALRQKAAKLRMPILVTDVRPGYVNTEMAKGEGQFWITTVEKAARQILIAIEAKKKIVYVSKRCRIVAAILKVIPGPIYERL